MKYKCLIADDEDLALMLLEDYIQKIPELELAASCVNGNEVKERLQSNSYNILMLDIQMPYVSGLEIAEGISGQPAVLFTSAYPEHAVESYRLNAIDYLLKPFLFDRFQQAVNKAIEYLNFKRQSTAKADHLYVKSDYRLVKLVFDEILYLEARKQYVKIHTLSGSLMTLETMKNFESKLPSDRFARVHKSFIVSKMQIKALNATSITVGKDLIPVGKTYRPVLDQWILT